MGNKDELLHLLSHAHDEVLKYDKTASDGERAITGSPARWSPKDELAHIAEWRFITATYLEAGLEGRTHDFYRDLDEKNAEIYESYRELPWLEVIDAQKRSYSRLVESVQSMPIDDLIDASRFPWLGGQSFWIRIVHNGYYHPLWHLAMLYLNRGNKDYGTQIMEIATRQVLALDASPNWQGHYLYNLACYFSLAADKLRALKILADALSMRPELAEVSQQDADLAPLRDEPAFQALVGREPPEPMESYQADRHTARSKRQQG